MQKPGIIFVVLVLAAALGCSRDPKVVRQKAFDRGQQYLAKHDYASARIEFMKAAQADASFAPAYYQLGIADQNLQDWNSAYQAYARAAELDPTNVDALLKKAGLEYAGRQWQMARGTAQKILDRDANNQQGLLLMGRIEFAQRNFDAAMQYFQKAAAAAPSSAEALDQIASTYLVTKRLDQAEVFYQKAIATDAKFYASYLNLAQLYGAEKKSDLQMETLNRAIRENPQAPTAYMMVAATYVRAGQKDKIEPLFASLRSASNNSAPALFAIASFYHANNDLDRAKSLLKEALGRDANYSEARNELIEIDLTQQNWDEADQLAQAILKSRPNDPQGRLYSARVLLGRGKAADAVKVLQSVVHDAPDMSAAYYSLGVAQAATGDLDAAIDSLSESLRRDPNQVMARLALSDLHLRKGNGNGALADAEAALAAAPQLPAAHLARANALILTGDIAGAQRELEGMADPAGNTATVQERLGFVLARQKRYPQAIDHLEKALSAQPDMALAMGDLMQIYQLQGRLPEGIARLEQQIQRVPNNSDFAEMLARAQVLNGNPAAAEQAWKSAIQKNAKAYSAYIGLANLYASQKRFADAIAEANAATSVRSDLATAYLLMGTFYEQSGSASQAQTAYQQALDRDSNSVMALNNLAWLTCEQGGNLDVALGLAQRAKARAPDDPHVSDTLGWIQYRKGLYGPATDSFQAAVHARPQTASFQYHLGLSLMKSGKSQEARTALQRALQLTLPPQDAEQARQALEQLAKAS